MNKIYSCDYCGGAIVIATDEIYCENCGCKFDDIVGLSFDVVPDTDGYDSDVGWDVND